MPLEQGQLVAGRFQLDRMIGRGGMGSVWKARDGRLDMPCAVKFIEGEIAQNPEATMRFEREAKAAAQLRSPHVVQILDHGVWETMPYIAMELLEGEDLGKRLLGRGRLSPAETAGIMTQVCRALSKAHTAGIVHRDLKPDNIFLCRDDDREIAKVVDFGIAKATNNALEMDSKTRTGSLLGTPYYMSPEQASGARDKPVDARSDLWSLAVIVYQCLTGALPFDGDALGDLLVKIIVGPIPKPSNVVNDLPLGFDDWWAKASSREPSQRYQTAKEFAESLSLVCGTSQMTDVMDRAVIQNALAAGTAADRSGQHPLGPTPTGGTMSRTIGQDLDGLDALAPKKKSAAPLLVGGLLGILALGGGFLAMKGKGEEAPAAAAAAVVAPAPVPAVAPAPAVEPAAAVDAGTHALEAEKAEQAPVAAPSAPVKKGRASGGFAPAPAAAPAVVPAPAPAPKPAAKPSSVGDDLGF
jgi:Protein kinase domain